MFGTSKEAKVSWRRGLVQGLALDHRVFFSIKLHIPTAKLGAHGGSVA